MTLTQYVQLALGFDVEPWQLRFLETIFVRTCRVCGCTDLRSNCQPPCWWVEPDLCSACPGETSFRFGTRGEFLAAFAGMTQFDLVLAAQAAETLEELDQVAHLSLVLFDHLGCLQPVARPDGYLVRSLHDQLIRERTRLGGFPDLAAQAARHDALSAAAAEQGRLERQADRQQRERAYQASRAPRVPTEGATP